MKPIKSTDDQYIPKMSFIEEARRKQIIDGTVDVLAENGYINTTFIRIAKQIKISPGLISYHFKNKEELLSTVLGSIMQGRAENMQQAINHTDSSADKLRSILASDLEYMGTRPKLFAAVVEVFYTLRDTEGLLSHLDENDNDSLRSIVGILKEGQQAGEFGDFDAYSMALIIDGARDQFLGQQLRRPDFDLDKFTETLIAFALKAVLKETA